MPTKIQKLRLQAFNNQHGRCWYCGVRMWHNDPAELPGVSQQAARLLKCTAEHLTARCDRGKDVAENVVAACAHCNHTRHMRKNPPTPEAYLADIRKRLARGGWHGRWVWTLGLLSLQPVCDVLARQPSPK